MKNNYLKVIVVLATMVFVNVQSQVGINNISPAGALDVTSTTDGMLIPRVALTATNVIAPVITPTASELVYNTATAGAGLTAVSPGYYYLNPTATAWIRVATGNNNDWSLTGNSGTTAGTNFVGTTDAQDLRFKTGVGGIDRLNISNTNGQVQSYYSGVAATPAYSWSSDSNTGIYQSAADNLSITTNGLEALRVGSTGNVTIGNTYSTVSPAPTNGLRVEGKSVIGKASGEDARDIFSSHNSVTAYQNITGYPGVANTRAVAGYADGSGIGLFGVANRTGYGVVGLTQPSVISSYVQTGEGVLGQADGSSGGPTRPIGVHGIIHETAAGNWRSTGVVGENNNVTPGVGFGGGPYATSGVTCGTYGNYASIGISSGTDMQAFGVAGDLLLIGGSIPDGSGGVFGAGGQGQFGMLGYNSYSGNSYGVYGGGGTNNGTINSGNTGRGTDLPIPNNLIGLGIHGGFMGGYIKGEQYGMLVKGKEFGMYVQGNTIVNKPIVQLIENKNSDTRTVAYMTTSTNVDVTTRGISSLKNGETFVAFKDAFKNLVSKDDYINVTVTPTSETNGVFVSKVTTEGFYIKENQKGKSNASFNWVAIGTRSGFENGVEISETILSNNFDKNINNATSNDGIDKVGFPIYFDGKNVLFERIPEKLVKQVSKETPKNK